MSQRCRDEGLSLGRARLSERYRPTSLRPRTQPPRPRQGISKVSPPAPPDAPPEPARRIPWSRCRPPPERRQRAHPGPPRARPSAASGKPAEDLGGAGGMPPLPVPQDLSRWLGLPVRGTGLLALVRRLRRCGLQPRHREPGAGLSPNSAFSFRCEVSSARALCSAPIRFARSVPS